MRGSEFSNTIYFGSTFTNTQMFFYIKYFTFSLIYIKIGLDFAIMTKGISGMTIKFTKGFAG